MKIRCARETLHQAFSVASTIVPQRTTIPAIGNVRISAAKAKKGDHLEIGCTDLEFGLRLEVPGAEVEEDGTLVLPAARVSGILRECQDETIRIEADGHLAQIRTPDASFKVVGIDPVDFPELPTFDAMTAVDVGTRDIGEMIRLTSFAVSNESVRYALTGQLLHLKGGELRMVATDGKRMAYVRRKSGGGEKSKEIRVVVPPKTLQLLDRVLTPEDETIAIHIEETQIRFKTSRAMIFSRLIDGNFPDYEAIIPKDRDKKVVVKRDLFLSAIRRVALMTTDQVRAVKLQIAPGSLVLFTRAQDVGEATVKVEAEFAGESIALVFNPDYVIDYLKAISDEVVELHFKDQTSAGVFRGSGEYTYVLMPLSVTL